MKILEELEERGYLLSAGVVNEGSDDCAICRALQIPHVEIPPFTPVTPQAQRENLKMMEDAEAVLISDIPFGQDNLANLYGLEQIKGKIFFHKNALSNDYTGGKLVERLEELGQKKKVIYFGDHDEFLKRLSFCRAENGKKAKEEPCG